MFRRVRNAEKPTRILYISDFDPAGMGMPVAVGRQTQFAFWQLEHLAEEEAPNVKLEPVALTYNQVTEWQLEAQGVRPGGRVANVGVHGQPATLHLETLWIKNITIRTGLVDTSSTPTLLKLVSEGRLDPTGFATHRFGLNEIMDAYDVFADAANTNAMKVVLSS